jgi:hypothetical protein
MSERDEGAVIELVCSNEFEALVAGIALDNLHGEISFGVAVGKEVF